MAKRFLVPLNLSPLTSDPINASEGDAYFNYVSNIIRVYYDGQWNDLSSASGGATNSFSNVITPDSTNIVADSSSDILNFSQSNGIQISGNSTTDTVNISTNATSLNTASTIISRDSDQSFDITGIDFDTVDSISSAVGRLSWDDGEGTLSLGLKGGNVNLQLGQEEVSLCYNGTGSQINKGSVVYISGAQGQRPSISLADADTEATSSKTFGIVAENISDGAEGFVATFGVVMGLNTLGFTAGQALWLSSTAGQLTNIKPIQPAHSVFIGYCLHVGASSGRIFVNPQNGYEIEELHNVSINSLQDNDILQYNSSNQLWENVQFSQDPIVPSGADYPSGSLVNGKLFYNTSNGRTGIYFNNIWKEFAYVGDISILDNGNSSTSIFSEIIDGGNSETTLFIGQYDGGLSV